ncbi:MAG TPA: biotin--[acetyl-CoA-carboxylase] ligase [Hymenobacter sp.]|uniref:biotin--[acetyl-CoA-carboxylase] ligase n=1 Tax=Hymenobacter sp. TaxID=1898978 RepID=UPI002D7F2A31|nr:biotin--[acetyl-CoA-carboxylase] ligase [Hymenobacter sp.]HET9506150.1 biotin--[acetyl-CoA-carboxylase] ligase [Hymenobacter sp.]
MVISPDTLFTGRQLVWLPACPSTNTVAQQLQRENRASDGCTVITGHQTAGRGQRGNQWEAAAHENLTLSVVWHPTFLAAAEQFLLSQAVALAALDWSRRWRGASAGTSLRVKWPNDLYVGNQKLGGILIENTLSGPKIQCSIVGIGLNVNQQAFAVPTATSLSQLTGRAYDLAEAAARLLECLEARYLQLRAGRVGQLRQDYLAALYRYRQPHQFLVDGQEATGEIVGVEADGRLAVQLAGGMRYFGLQEIRYL